MRAGPLCAILLCAASVGVAQEVPVVPQAECDTCQTRHRGLQSLQAARVGAAEQDRAVTGQPPPTRSAPLGSQDKVRPKE